METKEKRRSTDNVWSNQYVRDHQTGDGPDILGEVNTRLLRAQQKRTQQGNYLCFGSPIKRWAGIVKKNNVWNNRKILEMDCIRITGGLNVRRDGLLEAVKIENIRNLHKYCHFFPHLTRLFPVDKLTTKQMKKKNNVNRSQISRRKVYRSKNKNKKKKNRAHYSKTAIAQNLKYWRLK